MADEGPMDPVMLGRKDDPDFAPLAEPETVNEPEAGNEVRGAEAPETDAQRNAREQMADATRKWQEAAEMRRQVEQQQAQIAARERALAARAEALKPLETFDRMVATDQNLRDVVAPLIEGYRPGAAQLPTDQFVQDLNDVKQQNAQLAVEFARTIMNARYPDFAAQEDKVSEITGKLGLLRYGMKANEIVDGLDAAYQLATRPQAVAAQQAQTQANAARNDAAAKVGAGGSAAQRGLPPQDLPTRRPDGSLISYEEIAERARGRG